VSSDFTLSVARPASEGTVVAKRHAIVVSAEHPLHRTHGARARHHVDRDLIEAVAGFGSLGRHQLVHLVDAARPDLAHIDAGDIAFGKPHAQCRRGDHRLTLALDGIHELPAESCAMWTEMRVSANALWLEGQRNTQALPEQRGNRDDFSGKLMNPPIGLADRGERYPNRPDFFHETRLEAACEGETSCPRKDAYWEAEQCRRFRKLLQRGKKAQSRFTYRN
jgi:hypothetical protein